jgi:transposase
LVSSAKLLDDVYRTEHNGDVRERLLLVRRVLVDNEQTARVAENEFHRSRWWAYKWVKRYAESGLEGSKNLPRTGRPPQVSVQKFAEIKRELSVNIAGWKAKEIMNIIYEKTGVRYHEVHVLTNHILDLRTVRIFHFHIGLNQMMLFFYETSTLILRLLNK